MTTPSETNDRQTIEPTSSWLTPAGRRLADSLYAIFVGWQSDRVLSDMRDDQLARIGLHRGGSGRIAHPAL